MTEVAAVLTADDVFRDGSASLWLKSALQSALERDLVDALNDALLLASLLEDKLRAEYTL
jgi:hypothetical protein